MLTATVGPAKTAPAMPAWMLAASTKVLTCAAPRLNAGAKARALFTISRLISMSPLSSPVAVFKVPYMGPFESVPPFMSGRVIGVLSDWAGSSSGSSVELGVGVMSITSSEQLSG